MNKTDKILAIGVVAAVCVAAVGIYFFTVGDGDGDGDIKIADGSGKEIKLNEPLSDVVVVNTNILKSLKILGLEDEVVGVGYSSANTERNNASLTSLFPNVKKVPYTKEITVESMVPVTKYILCPVKSMSLSADQQTDLENLGVTVIRLECFGDTALDDLEKLTVLFGKTDSIMDAYDAYLETYNSAVSAVKEKVSAAGDTSGSRFLYYMDSAESFYNQTSDASIMIEAVYGKNILRDVGGLNTAGVTNSAAEDGIEESIRVRSSSIDKIFIRGAAGTDNAKAAGDIWTDSPFATSVSYPNLSAVSNGEVYIFDSDMMSGCLSYVGYILLAEVCGIDTGYVPASVIEDYNRAYGFSESVSGLVFKVSGGTVQEIY